MDTEVVLIGGIAGYLGGDLTKRLLDLPQELIVVGIDELSNKNYWGSSKVIEAVSKLTGVEHQLVGKRDSIDPKKRFFVYDGNISDISLLNQITRNHRKIKTVMNLASFIEAGGGQTKIITYARNNAARHFIFINHLIKKAGLERLIFSSTAAVLGSQDPGEHGYKEEDVFNTPRGNAFNLNKGIYQGRVIRGVESYKLILRTVLDRINDSDVEKYLTNPDYINCFMHPESIYGETKALAERINMYFNEKRGIQLIMPRYSNLVGGTAMLPERHSFPSRDSHVFTDLADVAYRLQTRENKRSNILKTGEYFRAFGGFNWKLPDGSIGASARDYLLKEDCIVMHTAWWEGNLHLDGIYHLGSGKPVQLDQLLKSFAAAVGMEFVYVRKEKYTIDKKTKTVTIKDQSLINPDALYCLEWDKRPGDPVFQFMNPEKANKVGWSARIITEYPLELQNILKSRYALHNEYREN